MAAPNLYSTLIGWAKVVLPLLAIAILSTLFLFSGRPDPEDAILFAGQEIEELARGQVLSHPRFAGTTEDGRAIVFAAESAAPVPDTSDRFTATTVTARVTLEPGLEALLDAAAAEVDMTAEEARLTGGVSVIRTDGLRLSTDVLTLGLSRLAAAAPGTIEATGPGLTLTAGAMTLSEADGPQLLSFTGGVRVLYDPGL
ncbi:hypothetical protein HKCCE3408_03040 [Rhodobacterales bacterium HKCCE3408]|nr:hypothetical protein [Rhodobacterales bacterium HKCCE3408]